MNIMGNLPIGELGERAIIDRFIVPLLSDEMGNILLDDCAVVKLPAPASLLLSTDQGPSHTFLDLLGVGTPADIGHFHVTINASDIAAMGGRPQTHLSCTGALRPCLTFVFAGWNVQRKSAKSI